MSIFKWRFEYIQVDDDDNKKLYVKNKTLKHWRKH